MVLMFSVDWVALGTWAGAFATAGAVYIAATLTDRQRRLDALELRKARYGVIWSACRRAEELVFSVYEAALAGEKGGPSPDSPDEFTHVLDVLNAAPIYEIGSWEATDDLIQVTRYLLEGRKLSLKFTTPRWGDIEATSLHLTSRATLKTIAYKAMLASKYGVWPHRNRAGDWVLPGVGNLEIQPSGATKLTGSRKGIFGRR
jgi:hypothetical protein